ncbi:MAG: N-acetylmuramoyl-L-alanine amidase [Bdellovibrionaceae bacterium]|nr:N-acetylmuramoyl-L-alanine amidase [Pseudobdellovibrionaceae bacterium]
MVTVYIVIFSLLTLAQDDAVSTGEVETSQSCQTECIYSLKSVWRTSAQKPKTSMLTTHTPKTIFLHHTGPPQKEMDLKKKLQKLYDYSIRAEGKKKAWGDIPYHFYIDKDANMMGARPVEFQPDTNTEFNPAGYVNITIEGNYTAKGGDKMTTAQKRVLKKLVADLKRTYKLASVKTHKDLAKTECPGTITASGL